MQDTQSLSRKEKYAIKPSNPFHQTWDRLKLLALLYLSIMVPLRIFLQCVAREDESSRCRLFHDTAGWSVDLIGEYAVDLFFLADMGLNYRFFAFTVVQNEKHVVKSHPKEIKARYLASWRFVVDVFASAPLDLISIAVGRHSLFRLNRLLRILLIDTYVTELQQHLEQSKKKLSLKMVSSVKRALILILMFHFVSVFWGILHFRQYEIDSR